MAGLKFTLAIEGLDIAIALTKPADSLLAQPWRKGMTALGSRLGLGAQRGAPVGKGKLQGSIRVAIQKRAFPTWIAIRVKARKKGYPYPLLLEFSRKHHHTGWLHNAVSPIIAQSDDSLEQIAANIAKAWEQG